MAMLQINGINLYVEVKGEGAPLIFIHGIRGDHTQWNYEIARLRKNFKTI